jgi:6-phosphogluconolactonase
MINTVYIGSFSKEEGAAVMRAHFDSLSGEIKIIDKINSHRPSWLTFAENNQDIFYTIETEETDGCYGGGIGLICASDDNLKIKSAINIGAKGPTHLCRAANYLYAACYAEGSLVEAELGNDGFTGKIKAFAHKGKSVHPTRQNMPHPHFSLITPDGEYLAVCDLGLDKIFLYPVDERQGITGSALTFDAPAGVARRHAVFAPDGHFMYVVCEMGCNILTYSYRNGNLSLIDSVSTLPEGDSTPCQCGAIRMNREGTELFVTNRGPDDIAFFEIKKDGKLKYNGSVKTGAWPRDAVFSPDGEWILCACQSSDEIVAYRYRYSDGSPTKERVKLVRQNELYKGSLPCSILFSNP